jgi:hypothetical protein
LQILSAENTTILLRILGFMDAYNPFFSILVILCWIPLYFLWLPLEWIVQSLKVSREKEALRQLDVMIRNGVEFSLPEFEKLLRGLFSADWEYVPTLQLRSRYQLAADVLIGYLDRLESEMRDLGAEGGLLKRQNTGQKLARILALAAQPRRNKQENWEYLLRKILPGLCQKTAKVLAEYYGHLEDLSRNGEGIYTAEMLDLPRVLGMALKVRGISAKEHPLLIQKSFSFLTAGYDALKKMIEEGRAWDPKKLYPILEVAAKIASENKIRDSMVADAGNAALGVLNAFLDSLAKSGDFAAIFRAVLGYSDASMLPAHQEAARKKVLGVLRGYFGEVLMQNEDTDLLMTFRARRVELEKMLDSDPGAVMPLIGHLLTKNEVSDFGGMNKSEWLSLRLRQMEAQLLARGDRSSQSQVGGGGKIKPEIEGDLWLNGGEAGGPENQARSEVRERENGVRSKDEAFKILKKGPRGWEKMIAGSFDWIVKAPYLIAYALITICCQLILSIIFTLGATLVIAILFLKEYVWVALLLSLIIFFIGSIIGDALPDLDFETVWARVPKMLFENIRMAGKKPAIRFLKTFALQGGEFSVHEFEQLIVFFANDWTEAARLRARGVYEESIREIAAIYLDTLKEEIAQRAVHPEKIARREGIHKKLELILGEDLRRSPEESEDPLAPNAAGVLDEYYGMTEDEIRAGIERNGDEILMLVGLLSRARSATGLSPALRDSLRRKAFSVLTAYYETVKQSVIKGQVWEAKKLYAHLGFAAETARKSRVPVEFAAQAEEKASEVMDAYIEALRKRISETALQKTSAVFLMSLEAATDYRNECFLEPYQAANNRKVLGILSGYYGEEAARDDDGRILTALQANRSKIEALVKADMDSAVALVGQFLTQTVKPDGFKDTNLNEWLKKRLDQMESQGKAREVRGTGPEATDTEKPTTESEGELWLKEADKNGPETGPRSEVRSKQEALKMLKSEPELTRRDHLKIFLINLSLMPFWFLVPVGFWVAVVRFVIPFSISHPPLSDTVAYLMIPISALLMTAVFFITTLPAWLWGPVKTHLMRSVATGRLIGALEFLEAYFRAGGEFTADEFVGFYKNTFQGGWDFKSKKVDRLFFERAARLVLAHLDNQKRKIDGTRRYSLPELRDVWVLFGRDRLFRRDPLRYLPKTYTDTLIRKTMEILYGMYGVVRSEDGAREREKDKAMFAVLADHQSAITSLFKSDPQSTDDLIGQLLMQAARPGGYSEKNLGEWFAQRINQLRSQREARELRGEIQTEYPGKPAGENEGGELWLEKNEGKDGPRSEVRSQKPHASLKEQPIASKSEALTILQNEQNFKVWEMTVIVLLECGKAIFYGSLGCLGILVMGAAILAVGILCSIMGNWGGAWLGLAALIIICLLSNFEALLNSPERLISAVEGRIGQKAFLTRVMGRWFEAREIPRKKSALQFLDAYIRQNGELSADEFKILFNMALFARLEYTSERVNHYLRQIAAREVGVYLNVLKEELKDRKRQPERIARRSDIAKKLEEVLQYGFFSEKDKGRILVKRRAAEILPEYYDSLETSIREGAPWPADQLFRELSLGAKAEDVFIPRALKTTVEEKALRVLDAFVKTFLGLNPWDKNLPEALDIVGRYSDNCFLVSHQAEARRIVLSILAGRYGIEKLQDADGSLLKALQDYRTQIEALYQKNPETAVALVGQFLRLAEASEDFKGARPAEWLRKKIELVNAQSVARELRGSRQAADQAQSPAEDEGSGDLWLEKNQDGPESTERPELRTEPAEAEWAEHFELLKRLVPVMWDRVFRIIDASPDGRWGLLSGGYGGNYMLVYLGAALPAQEPAQDMPLVMPLSLSSMRTSGFSRDGNWLRVVDHYDTRNDIFDPYAEGEVVDQELWIDLPASVRAGGIIVHQEGGSPANVSEIIEGPNFEGQVFYAQSTGLRDALTYEVVNLKQDWLYLRLADEGLRSLAFLVRWGIVTGPDELRTIVCNLRAIFENPGTREVLLGKMLKLQSLGINTAEHRDALRGVFREALTQNVDSADPERQSEIYKQIERKLDQLIAQLKARASRGEPPVKNEKEKPGPGGADLWLKGEGEGGEAGEERAELRAKEEPIRSKDEAIKMITHWFDPSPRWVFPIEMLAAAVAGFSMVSFLGVSFVALLIEAVRMKESLLIHEWRMPLFWGLLSCIGIPLIVTLQMLAIRYLFFRSLIARKKEAFSYLTSFLQNRGVLTESELEKVLSLKSVLFYSYWSFDQTIQPEILNEYYALVMRLIQAGKIVPRQTIDDMMYQLPLAFHATSGHLRESLNQRALEALDVYTQSLAASGHFLELFNMATDYSDDLFWEPYQAAARGKMLAGLYRFYGSKIPVEREKDFFEALQKEKERVRALYGDGNEIAVLLVGHFLNQMKISEVVKSDWLKNKLDQIEAQSKAREARGAEPQGTETEKPAAGNEGDLWLGKDRSEFREEPSDEEWEGHFDLLKRLVPVMWDREFQIIDLSPDGRWTLLEDGHKRENYKLAYLGVPLAGQKAVQNAPLVMSTSLSSVTASGFSKDGRWLRVVDYYDSKPNLYDESEFVEAESWVDLSASVRAGGIVEERNKPANVMEVIEPPNVRGQVFYVQATGSHAPLEYKVADLKQDWLCRLLSHGGFRALALLVHFGVVRGPNELKAAAQFLRSTFWFQTSPRAATNYYPQLLKRMLELREAWVDTEGNRDALRNIFGRGFTQKIDSQNPEEQEGVRSQIHGRLGQFISQLTARAVRGKGSSAVEKENPTAGAGELWAQRPDRSELRTEPSEAEWAEHFELLKRLVPLMWDRSVQLIDLSPDGRWAFLGEIYAEGNYRLAYLGENPSPTDQEGIRDLPLVIGMRLSSLFEDGGFTEDGNWLRVVDHYVSGDGAEFVVEESWINLPASREARDIVSEYKGKPATALEVMKPHDWRGQPFYAVSEDRGYRTANLKRDWLRSRLGDSGLRTLALLVHLGVVTNSRELRRAEQFLRSVFRRETPTRASEDYFWKLLPKMLDLRGVWVDTEGNRDALRHIFGQGFLQKIDSDDSEKQLEARVQIQGRLDQLIAQLKARAFRDDAQMAGGKENPPAGVGDLWLEKNEDVSGNDGRAELRAELSAAEWEEQLDLLKRLVPLMWDRDFLVRDLSSGGRWALLEEQYKKESYKLVYLGAQPDFHSGPLGEPLVMDMMLSLVTGSAFSADEKWLRVVDYFDRNPNLYDESDFTEEERWIDLEASLKSRRIFSQAHGGFEEAQRRILVPQMFYLVPEAAEKRSLWETVNLEKNQVRKVLGHDGLRILAILADAGAVKNANELKAALRFFRSTFYLTTLRCTTNYFPPLLKRMLDLREVWADTEGNRDALRDIFGRGFMQKIDSKDHQKQEKVRGQIQGRLGQLIAQLKARASRDDAQMAGGEENPPAGVDDLWLEKNEGEGRAGGGVRSEARDEDKGSIRSKERAFKILRQEVSVQWQRGIIEMADSLFRLPFAFALHILTLFFEVVSMPLIVMPFLSLWILPILQYFYYGWAAWIGTEIRIFFGIILLQCLGFIVKEDLRDWIENRSFFPLQEMEISGRFESRLEQRRVLRKIKAAGYLISKERTGQLLSDGELGEFLGFFGDRQSAAVPGEIWRDFQGRLLELTYLHYGLDVPKDLPGGVLDAFQRLGSEISELSDKEPEKIVRLVGQFLERSMIQDGFQGAKPSEWLGQKLEQLKTQQAARDSRGRSQVKGEEKPEAGSEGDLWLKGDGKKPRSEMRKRKLTVRSKEEALDIIGEHISTHWHPTAKVSRWTDVVLFLVVLIPYWAYLFLLWKLGLDQGGILMLGIGPGLLGVPLVWELVMTRGFEQKESRLRSEALEFLEFYISRGGRLTEQEFARVFYSWGGLTEFIGRGYLREEAVRLLAAHLRTFREEILRWEEIAREEEILREWIDLVWPWRKILGLFGVYFPAVLTEKEQGIMGAAILPIISEFLGVPIPVGMESAIFGTIRREQQRLEVLLAKHADEVSSLITQYLGQTARPEDFNPAWLTDKLNLVEAQVRARESRAAPGQAPVSDERAGGGDLWLEKNEDVSGDDGRAELRMKSNMDQTKSARPEMRSAGDASENIIRETAVTVLASRPKDDGYLERLSQKIQGVLVRMPVGRFVEKLRSSALKRLRNIEKHSGILEKDVAQGPRVDSDLAQTAVNYFIGRYLKAEVEGSYAVAFDLPADANFREALMQTRSRIGLAILSKRMARDLNKSYLKNIRYQLASHLRKLHVPGMVHNRRAVPVVGEGDSQRLDPSLFEVRLKNSEREGEPYLEVVERVVQVLAGLLTASQIARAAELQDPRKAEEIKETLLKQLFNAEFGGSDLIGIQNGMVVLDRELLRNFIMDHLAAQSFSQAA